MKLIGRSILAYYTHRGQAEDAQAQLRRQGFDTVQLDRISRYGGESAQQLHNPLTGAFGSLASLSAGADTDGDDDAGVLIAADTSASGFADGGGADYAPGVHEQAWLITVVTSEDRANRAVHILEETGGTV